jgi:hypothetical protein
MKSSTVFAIATAFGLTFASVITAVAHHRWSTAGEAVAERNIPVKHLDATRTSAVAN